MKSGKILIFTFSMLACLVTISHFEPALDFLKSGAFSFKVGVVTLSVFSILQTIFAVGLLFSASLYASKIIESRINNLETKPSTKGLLTKSSYVLLYFSSFLMTLKVIGIDITTLTVFGGAIFVGIGLGLQKIASNFIAGMFLLFEKSFEIGDILELSDGTTGIVKHTGARYTLLEEFSGKETTVPNEELFINRVTNWTHSNTKIRAEISIKVPYKHGLDETKNLIESIAIKSNNCLKNPKPFCIVKDIDEGRILFILFCWIDVTRGFTISESEVRAEVWRDLKQHNIEVCMPQREIKISYANDIKN